MIFPKKHNRNKLIFLVAKLLYNSLCPSVTLVVCPLRQGELVTQGHLSLMKLCTNILWMNISIFHFLTFDLRGYWRPHWRPKIFCLVTFRPFQRYYFFFGSLYFYTNTPQMNITIFHFMTFKKVTFHIMEAKKISFSDL